MLSRIKQACRTNEPQCSSVVLLTLLNVAAMAGSSSVGGWTVAALLWPTIAFVGNVVSPIPADDGESQ